MRSIEEHKVNPINDVIDILVLDEPGAGGACHEYGIEYQGEEGWVQNIWFQKGPIAEEGPNGLTQEVLIAICIDRLRGFQSGQFAHPANAEALEHLEAAQAALFGRTKERIDRGVEGTSEV